MSRPPNSTSSQRSGAAGPSHSFAHEGSPPSRASTHSIPVSYAYGAPVDSPGSGGPSGAGGGVARSATGSRSAHHQRTSSAMAASVDQQDVDAASVVSGGTTALSMDRLGPHHESAAVRYARLAQRVKDTGSPHLPKAPGAMPSPSGARAANNAALASLGQNNTSVNIAVAFKEATRGAGGVVRGQKKVRVLDEESEEEDEELDGTKETRIDQNGSGSRKRKKRSSKDPTFKPGQEQSDADSGEDSEAVSRGKTKRPRTISAVDDDADGGQEDGGQEVNGHADTSTADTTPHKKSHRRKSGDATYRPTATSDAESSEYESEDENSRRRKKGKGRASTGGSSIAIPIGRRDNEVWYGKKRKGRKGQRSGGGSGEGEDGDGTGSGEEQRDDVGGDDYSVFDNTPSFTHSDAGAAASTSFFLRPRSPSAPTEPDPAFAAFDRSVSTSGASFDGSGVRGSSYDYSEEERIVAALEQQKRQRSGAASASGTTKRRNRLPGPPVRQPFLGGIAEESEGSATSSRLLDSIRAVFRSAWRAINNPLLDWSKIWRTAALATAALAILLAFLLSPSRNQPPPPPDHGRSLSSYIPFFGHSNAYTPPSGNVDSLPELVSRLTVLERAMGQLSSLTEEERTSAKKERQALVKLGDQVSNLETSFEQEHKKVSKALSTAEAASTKESRELHRDLQAVKGDLDTLLARVRALTDDQRADAEDIRRLQNGVTTVGKDIASLGTKVAKVAQDVQAGIDADRIAKIALDAIEARLPSKLAVRLGPSGKLEIDPAFWKHLRDAFVDKNDVDSLVDGKVATAIARSGPTVGKSAPVPPPVIKQPSWQEFLVANEASLRSLISSDIGSRTGSDAILTKRAFLDLLHREIKSLKSDFEAKTNKNVEKIGQEILGKVAKQEQLRRDTESRHAPTSARSGPITIKSPDGQNITAVIDSIVDSALLRYSKDVLARPDFALATSGARVIPSLTSPTYEIKPVGLAPRAIAWFSRTSATPGHPPVTALLPQNSLGWCWPFAGPQGQLGILLSRRVVPSDVTIEHASVDVSLDGEVTSAPKDFEVWGVVEGREDSERLAEYRAETLASKQRNLEAGVELDDDELSASLPPSPNHILLAAGSYDVSHSSHIQTFPVTPAARQLAIPVGVVVVKILSNHGDPHYTCLYRVRISGSAVTSP